jgi:hypothetical protein
MPDESKTLDKDAKKYIQAVAGTFLYYARAVDSTMLTALSAIATQQASPTEDTKSKVTHFLDYCASQEEAILTYRKSDMILSVHSDAGYLNERNARSRAGGHFFLSNDEQFPANNGAILNVAQIIKAVMSSAAEAELAALYINAREAVYIRQILQELGHPQPRTPIQTDNSTAEGVINNKIQPKRTRAMDMRLHWLRDREAQRQFRFYWRPGGKNLADYWTKHHAPTHHKNVRGEFLTSRVNLRTPNKETASHCYGMTAARVCQTSQLVWPQTKCLASNQCGASGPTRATARQPSILAAHLRAMNESLRRASRV